MSAISVKVLHPPAYFADARPGFPAHRLAPLPWVGGDSTVRITRDREDR